MKNVLCQVPFKQYGVLLYLQDSGFKVSLVGTPVSYMSPKCGALNLTMPLGTIISPGYQQIFTDLLTDFTEIECMWTIKAPQQQVNILWIWIWIWICRLWTIKAPQQQKLKNTKLNIQITYRTHMISKLDYLKSIMLYSSKFRNI